MITSRSLNDLLTPVAEKAGRFLVIARDAGINLLITATYRDAEAQAQLYAQGRTAPGKIVTNARAGESFHNWRVALDVVPLEKGQCVWNDDALWQRVGELGEQVGLQWGGRWTTLTDKPHFQYTAGLTVRDFQEGKTLPENA